MTKLKILNLYAGIGGNRKLWDTLGLNIEVTAVENNEEIAKIYSDLFPNDKVIIADAHQFLLEHFKEFDFIWSSPPCQSHSRARFWSSKGGRYDPVYPDMKLYQEVIFLQNFFEGKWIVENTLGYYPPLITPQQIGRHFFWSNFPVSSINFQKVKFYKDDIVKMEKLNGLSIKGKKVNNRKDQILRNCVNPELGLHILKMAFKEPQLTL